MDLFKSEWLREVPRPAPGSYRERRFAPRYGRRAVLSMTDGLATRVCQPDAIVVSPPPWQPQDRAA